jgi:hypothetical protein
VIAKQRDIHEAHGLVDVWLLEGWKRSCRDRINGLFNHWYSITDRD